jgi:DNA repair photolyase
MNLEYKEYRARKILNAHKHVDGAWFWDKYSAHPYIGCRSGCAFCYTRGGPYLGKRDPVRFDSLIQVKTNAAELLLRELPRQKPDVIACGDWQEPAESTYRLSRAMLEVVNANSFPLLVIERSPSLLRDLDLLQSIQQRSWAGVVFSFSNVDPSLKKAFEPCSPGLTQRLKAMEKIAKTGILVGMSLMPILPLVGDDDSHLTDAIRAAQDHGASFILGAGLTMAGAQADYTLAAYKSLDPGWEARIRRLYGWPPDGQPIYGPPAAYAVPLSRKVREICARFGLADRMPRYIGNGPLAINRRIAEQLFLKTYDLELEQAAPPRIWAYRKAAWAVEDWPISLGQLFELHGEAGIRTLPGIGNSISVEITGWICRFQEMKSDNAPITG